VAALRPESLPPAGLQLQEVIACLALQFALQQLELLPRRSAVQLQRGV